MGIKRVGFTKRQREWFHRVYGHKCHFPIFQNGGWDLSGLEKELQVHHYKPKRFYYDNIGVDPNIPENGILISAYHHIGKGYRGPLTWYETDVPIIHPDLEVDRRQYKRSDVHPYQTVMDRHREQSYKGLIYWNDSFDSVLEEIINETVPKYLKDNPEDQYPLSRRQQSGDYR